MKQRTTAFLPLLLCALLAVRRTAASLNQTIASINSDAKKAGRPESASSRSRSARKVPVATLEKEKARTSLTYGDLFAAHAIAKASGKSFDEVVTLKSKGESWDKIAETLNVSLDGKKKAQAPAAKTTPNPAPKNDFASYRHER